MVELLLKHGANPQQPNSQGKTPLDLAASTDMVKLLRKEIITSSSDSSSLEDIRSPTSPESNASYKEEDFRNSDNEDRGKIWKYMQDLSYIATGNQNNVIEIKTGEVTKQT